MLVPITASEGRHRSRRLVFTPACVGSTLLVLRAGASLVPGDAMDPRLDSLRHSLDSAVEGMSSEELAWHLPGKWSAAQVLEHLYLTYTGTTRGLEKVLTRGAPLATKPSIPQRVMTFGVVRLHRIPAGREAPAIVKPKGLPVEQVRCEIWEKLAAMDATIARCEARFGCHVKLLDHPILGALTAAEWRTLHVVHGRHHQRQLLRLRNRTVETR